MPEEELRRRKKEKNLSSNVLNDRIKKALSNHITKTSLYISTTQR